MEEGGGSLSGVGVLWLHEDERHGRFGPIGLDEWRKGAVASAE